MLTPKLHPTSELKTDLRSDCGLTNKSVTTPAVILWRTTVNKENGESAQLRYEITCQSKRREKTPQTFLRETTSKTRTNRRSHDIKTETIC